MIQITGQTEKAIRRLLEEKRVLQQGMKVAMEVGDDESIQYHIRELNRTNRDMGLVLSASLSEVDLSYETLEASR